MAETNLRQYGTEERLNKMDVDLIDVTVTLHSSAYESGDFMFTVTEIPNAVSVNGGRCIIQSVSAIVENHATPGSGDGTTTGDFDIIITSDGTGMTKSSDTTPLVLDEAMSTVATTPMSVLDGTCGIVSLSNMIDVGEVAIGNEANIGIVGKAIDSSKSLYCWGIARSTNNYATGLLTLRFGVVKD